jgi:uncharacterized membrane protein
MRFLNILIGVALALVGLVIFFFGFLGGASTGNWVLAIASVIFGLAILVYGKRMQREG